MTFVSQNPSIYGGPRPGTPDWYEEKREAQAPIPKRWEEGLKDLDNSVKTENPVGIKENEGKLFYELDFKFIEAMAKRMADNKKGKYPRWNWKKAIDPEELKHANFRHMVEVMEGNYDDEGKAFDHIVAISCNAMMLWHRLKAEAKAEDKNTKEEE